MKNKTKQNENKTKTMFADVDRLLQNQRDENEMNAFLTKGTMPKYLEQKTLRNPVEDIARYISDVELSRSPVSVTRFQQSYDNASFHNCISKCDRLMEQIIGPSEKVFEKADYEKEKLDCDDVDCPVCMEPIGTTGYMIPQCGHKICNACMFQNIRMNRDTGTVCCICRESILH